MSKHEEVKPEVKQQSTKEMVKEVLEEVLPTAMMASTQVAMNQFKPVKQVSTHERLAKCPDCRQARLECKGEHEMAVVYPVHSPWANSFPGVQLNGETYRSDDSGHKICIPKNSDIPFFVQAWAESENRFRVPQNKKQNNQLASL